MMISSTGYSLNVPLFPQPTSGTSPSSRQRVDGEVVNVCYCLACVVLRMYQDYWHYEIVISPSFELEQPLARTAFVRCTGFPDNAGLTLLPAEAVWFPYLVLLVNETHRQQSSPSSQPPPIQPTVSLGPLSSHFFNTPYRLLPLFF